MLVGTCPSGVQLVDDLRQALAEFGQQIFLRQAGAFGQEGDLIVRQYLGEIVSYHTAWFGPALDPGFHRVSLTGPAELSHEIHHAACQQRTKRPWRSARP